MPWFHGGSQTSSTLTSSTGFEGEQLVLHVLRKHRPHAAAGRGQRHLHVHACNVSGAPSGVDVAIVDQAQVHDVDRDFRVVTGPQLVPDFLFRFPRRAWPRRCRRGLGGRTSRPSASASLAFDAEHVAVDDDGVAAAERLRDVGLLALLQRDLRADGDHGRLRRRGSRLWVHHGIS